MGETLIFVTKDKELAARTAKFWLIENPDYQGAVVADTAMAMVADAADPFNAKWTTGGDGPWYLVLATPDSFATGNGPAARLAGEAEDGGAGD